MLRDAARERNPTIISRPISENQPDGSGTQYHIHLDCHWWVASRPQTRLAKLAIDSSYGLGRSIITNDVERGRRIARQIDTGMVFINQACWTAPDLPFGGVKNSGYGRELSDLGIGEFLNRKLIGVV